MASIEYTLVERKDSLDNLISIIASLNENDYIALDTEFVRCVTYYPIFAILQLKVQDKIYIVDVMKLGEGDIIHALNHTKATILMFSCDEDIEVIANASRKCKLDKLVPDRILDVQLLGSFANFAHKTGLTSFVGRICKKKLEKEQTLSDWTERPLSDSQLLYAAFDVEYLQDIFDFLKEKTTDKHFAWFVDEMDFIKKEMSAYEDEDLAYTQIAGAGMLNAMELSNLYYLAKERVIKARAENIALNQLITTKSLWQLARFKPKSIKGLIEHGVKEGCARTYGQYIIDLVKRVATYPVAENLETPLDTFSQNREYKDKFKRLKSYLSKVAHEEGIRPELLSAKRLIQDFYNSRSLGRKSILDLTWRHECLPRLDEYL